MRLDFALNAQLQESMRSHAGDQMRNIAEPIFVAPHVTTRLEAELEAAHTLIGVIARAEMRIHDRLTDFVDEVEASQVADDDSHCCCCAAIICAARATAKFRLVWAE